MFQVSYRETANRDDPTGKDPKTDGDNKIPRIIPTNALDRIPMPPQLDQRFLPPFPRSFINVPEPDRMIPRRAGQQPRSDGVETQLPDFPTPPSSGENIHR